MHRLNFTIIKLNVKIIFFILYIHVYIKEILRQIHTERSLVYCIGMSATCNDLARIALAFALTSTMLKSYAFCALDGIVDTCTMNGLG